MFEFQTPAEWESFEHEQLTKASVFLNAVDFFGKTLYNNRTPTEDEKKNVIAFAAWIEIWNCYRFRYKTVGSKIKYRRLVLDVNIPEVMGASKYFNLNIKLFVYSVVTCDPYGSNYLRQNIDRKARELIMTEITCKIPDMIADNENLVYYHKKQVLKDSLLREFTEPEIMIND